MNPLLQRDAAVRRTYNRRVGDGLIQTVNLQMGQKGMRGRFTVNLGVGLPALRPIELGREFPASINQSAPKVTGVTTTLPASMSATLTSGKPTVMDSL